MRSGIDHKTAWQPYRMPDDAPARAGVDGHDRHQEGVPQAVVLSKCSLNNFPPALRESIKTMQSIATAGRLARAELSFGSRRCIDVHPVPLLNAAAARASSRCKAAGTIAASREPALPGLAGALVQATQALGSSGVFVSRPRLAGGAGEFRRLQRW